ncbi:MAG TPA: (2Fe-2S)-binding protein [Gammaproteobacteria bacterium]|nr:(2Fe-2S)-binding protein [Gammaproteobacteria bacterium]
MDVADQRTGERPEAAGLVGPGPVPVALRVNGELRRIAVEPRTTLAEALRGPLGLKGTKLACDHGACSACSVWLDGRVVASCSILAIEIGDREVTSIEGLASYGALHPVQEAFIAHDAVQCGFCTPGLVMSCAALLASNPRPGPDQVRAAISGHVCRCGTYPHVIRAMRSLAGPGGAGHGR